MTEQRSGGGARSIRQRGDRPSENGLAGPAGGGAAERRSALAPPSRRRCPRPSPGTAPSSLSSALYVWSNTPPAEIAPATPSDNHPLPPPPEAFTTAEPRYKTGSRGLESVPLPFRILPGACRPSCGEFANAGVAGRRVLPSARDPRGNCTSAVVPFYGM